MERIIPEHETIEIEFKSDIKKLSDSDLIDAIVAFANTHGGDLYLGVEAVSYTHLTLPTNSLV